LLMLQLHQTWATSVVCGWTHHWLQISYDDAISIWGWLKWFSKWDASRVTDLRVVWFIIGSSLL